MTNLEKPNTQESALEKEINNALKEFSAEKMTLKNSITNKKKDIEPRTKEEKKE